MTIKIAIAGHTNVGKTTLIRTLMRTTVGEVDDKADVTKKGKLYYYDGLQATFIDTPGFRQSSIALDYLKGEKLSPEKQKKLELDLNAIEFIKESDVVIYLANLGVTPDSSHEDEIEVVKKIQPKIVGVLNQYKETLKGGGLEKANSRCSQWTEMLNEKGVNGVIVFDAHWDRRSKEKEIYDAINEVLDDNQKSDFRDGLRKFKDRQNGIRQEVCIDLAERVEKLQEIDEKIRKGQYDGTRKEEIDRKIANEINRETTKFILYVSKLYEVAAEYPTHSAQDLIMRTKNEINFPERLTTTANATAVIGGFFSIIGGILGGTVVGLLSGGLGIIPGAIEGAKIFGAVGAALGAFTIFHDEGDQTRIKMTSPQIENIVKDLLAIVWGLEHNGFGRSSVLTEDEAKDMRSLVDELHAKQSNYDWTKINRGEVMHYGKNILKNLENY